MKGCFFRVIKWTLIVFGAVLALAIIGTIISPPKPKQVAVVATVTLPATDPTSTASPTLPASTTTNTPPADTLLPTSIPTVTHVPSITSTPTKLPQPATTPLPTDTPPPTVTRTDTSTPTGTPAPIDTSLSPASQPTTSQPQSAPNETAGGQPNKLPALISASAEQVESMLGQPSSITPFSAGDYVNYEGEGETRDYSWNGYLITGYYDMAKTLRGFQIVDGLTAKGYRLSEWPMVLSIFGLSDDVQPDIAAPAAVRWENLDGYKVSVVADGDQLTSAIWTIQIFAIE